MAGAAPRCARRRDHGGDTCGSHAPARFKLNQAGGGARKGLHVSGPRRRSGPVPECWAGCGWGQPGIAPSTASGPPDPPRKWLPAMANTVRPGVPGRFHQQRFKDASGAKRFGSTAGSCRLGQTQSGPSHSRALAATLGRGGVVPVTWASWQAGYRKVPRPGALGVEAGMGCGRGSCSAPGTNRSAATLAWGCGRLWYGVHQDSLGTCHEGADAPGPK